MTKTPHALARGGLHVFRHEAATACCGSPVHLGGLCPRNQGVQPTVAEVSSGGILTATLRVESNLVGPIPWWISDCLHSVDGRFTLTVALVGGAAMPSWLKVCGAEASSARYAAGSASSTSAVNTVASAVSQRSAPLVWRAGSYPWRTRRSAGMPRDGAPAHRTSTPHSPGAPGSTSGLANTSRRPEPATSLRSTSEAAASYDRPTTCGSCLRAFTTGSATSRRVEVHGVPQQPDGTRYLALPEGQRGPPLGIFVPITIRHARGDRSQRLGDPGSRRHHGDSDRHWGRHAGERPGACSRPRREVRLESQCHRDCPSERRGQSEPLTGSHDNAVPRGLSWRRRGRNTPNLPSTPRSVSGRPGDA